MAKFKVGDKVIHNCDCDVDYCQKMFNSLCVIVEEYRGDFRIQQVGHNEVYGLYDAKDLKPANSQIIKERLGIK